MEGRGIIEGEDLCEENVGVKNSIVIMWGKGE